MTEQVEIDVGPADVDLVSGLLWAAGVDAVEERPAPDGSVTLVTAPDSPLLRSVLAGRWPLRVVPVDDTVLDTWRAWAEPVHVGRLVVVPTSSGDRRPPVRGHLSPEAVVVGVDPGRVFGHGAHPTTRAVLDQLVARLLPGATVLDFGCGSGVLAVSAAALGAARVVAVDVDPDAVVVTRANAEANGVAGRVEASTAPVAGVDGAFDLVLANIGAATLVELAPELAARVAPAGALVLSGLLHDRRDEVLAAYRGMAVDAEVVVDGWCTLALVRR